MSITRAVEISIQAVSPALIEEVGIRPPQWGAEARNGAAPPVKKHRRLPPLAYATRPDPPIAACPKSRGRVLCKMHKNFVSRTPSERSCCAGSLCAPAYRFSSNPSFIQEFILIYKDTA